MKVLLFKSTSNASTDKLLEIVNSTAGTEHVHLSGDLDTLIGALLKYRIEMPVVVLWMDSHADVPKIRGLSDILDGLFLIIVANHETAGLVSSCRQLFPRLLIHSEEDFRLVGAVIEKRLAKGR